MTQHSRGSRPGQETTIRDEGGRPASAVLGVLLGILGVIAAFVPGLFWIAWILGAGAIATAVPALRVGSTDPSYDLGRIAAGAGLLAVVVGVLNLGITLDWFTFFTTGTDSGS